jgi:hypothetical protein
MADWQYIYMEFDPPLPEDLREKVYADLCAEDYDFPKDALVFQDWVNYRSPIGDLGKVLGELGLSGRYWLFGNPFGNEPQDKDRNDENIVEFGPAVTNPYARRDAYRTQLRESARNISAIQVVAALRELQAWFATAEPRDFKAAARILRQGTCGSDDRFQELCVQEWNK